jgi:hypothetical protein
MTTPDKNRQLRLAARPEGRVKPTDFNLVEAPLPEPGPGQALVRNLYLSLDPTNRVWMADRAQYMQPVQLGEVMRGSGLGQVVRSQDPALPPGTLVQGLLGWQDYALVGKDAPEGHSASPLPSGLGVPLETFLGVLGMTGLTAYFGLMDIAKPKPGETVVVSAAAGAVGSVAGQIAKILGARAVGIAGSDEKCAWLRELGYDEAINYKHPDWKKQLAKACPNGIDVDFENVGGEILDAVLRLVNIHARVALCGLISAYNADKPVPGPYNFGNLVIKRVRVEGFLILDYLSKSGEAFRDLARWYKEGRIKHRDTVVDGLEQAPTAINMLFDGENMGKLMVKIAAPPLPVA